MRSIRRAADAGFSDVSEPAGKPDAVCGHAIMEESKPDDKIPPGDTDSLARC